MFYKYLVSRVYKKIFISLIKQYEIYKTELTWNLHSSGRMTHRFVFLNNGEIAGMYVDIQSNNFYIENNKIVFSDILTDNKIEIRETLPEKILIDRELICLEK